MKTLPDPRAYAPFSSNPLVMAAENAAKADSALQQEDAGEMLLSRVREALETSNDARIEQALAQATSRPVRELLTRALGSALEARDEAALVMRVFAIPLLIVTGGRSLAVVPGVVPDAYVGPLRECVKRLWEQGIPLPFAFVYDEFWLAFQGISRLLEGALGTRYRAMPGFWAWYLPPSEDASGWGPHRDRGPALSR